MLLSMGQTTVDQPLIIRLIGRKGMSEFGDNDSFAYNEYSGHLKTITKLKTPSMAFDQAGLYSSNP